MGILKVDGLQVNYCGEVLFANVGFELQRGEKAGLIGANGTGKTTLMRSILGIEQFEAGNITIPPGERIGYVEQDVGQGTGTLGEELRNAYRDIIVCQERMRQLEEAIAREEHEPDREGLMREYAMVVEKFETGGGYSYENMIRRVTSGLGFAEEDLARDIATFSGGQKTRINLAKALIRQPDFLFLDEPTNHLDTGMVEWLEAFLRDYPGGVLVISHDRYFLDRVVSRILELEGGVLIDCRGNYSEYLNQKAERIASQQAAYEKQQAYIAQTEEFVRRYRAGVKARQARGRQSQLSRIERLAAPDAADRLNLEFEMAGGCAERVAELIEVTASYNAKPIFENLSMLIRRGESVALIGPNGVGKTTLLKLLTGHLQPAAGRVKLGSRVKIGYFAQEHERMNSNFRVLDELTVEFGFSEERARNYLGAFLFRGDDVFKTVAELSGGEKARLALLKLMLTGANFLILDEPTNHLDIGSKEAVEQAIVEYPGTFLVVSHDRFLLDRVVDRVVELSDGELKEYPGNYSYYREKKFLAMRNNAHSAKPKKAEKTEKSGPSRRRPLDASRQIKKLEEEIAALELEKAVAEEKLNDPASHDDPVVSRNLAAEYAALEHKLAARYDEWIKATEEV